MKEYIKLTKTGRYALEDRIGRRICDFQTAYNLSQAGVKFYSDKVHPITSDDGTIVDIELEVVDQHWSLAQRAWGSSKPIVKAALEAAAEQIPEWIKMGPGSGRGKSPPVEFEFAGCVWFSLPEGSFKARKPRHLHKKSDFWKPMRG